MSDALVDALAETLAESEPEPLATGEARALAAAALADSETETETDSDTETETETETDSETVPADHVDEPSGVEGPRPDTQREGSPPTASSAASDSDLVDALAATLGESEPEPLDDDDARALAEAALTEADDAPGAEVVQLDAFKHMPLLAAAAVILFVVAAATLASPGQAPPTVHRFASGHRVVAGPGALLSFRESADALLVDLDGGEAMFDVDPDTGQHVTVVTGGITVRVTGTVFTVSRARDRVRVAVFEGNVAVTGGGPLALLSANDRWEGKEGRAIADASFEPRLHEEAAYAADRRAEHAERLDDFVPNLPAVPDLAADGRLPPTGADDEDEPSDDPEEQAPVASPSGDAPRPTIDDARVLLTERRYEEARGMADRALRGGPNADWLMIRGDALRGEGSLDEAASEYTRAALVGDGRDRAVAGLSAARLLGRELGRVGSAREVLVSSGALEPSSPVRAQAQALARELGIVVE